MIQELSVGSQFLADGTIARARGGRNGEMIVSELGGQYRESCYRGEVFHACMTAGIILPAPLATVANVMTLFNPAGSGKNIDLISFDMVLTAAPGTPVIGTYGLFVNTNIVAAPVTGTALNPICGFIGTNYPTVAKAFTTSTLPAAPTYFWPIASKLTGAITTIPDLMAFHVEFNGTAILYPGTAITPQQTAADSTNATVLCAFRWRDTTP